MFHELRFLMRGLTFFINVNKKFTLIQNNDNNSCTDKGSWVCITLAKDIGVVNNVSIMEEDKNWGNCLDDKFLMSDTGTEKMMY